MKYVALLISLVAGLALCAASGAADWITAPSYYTHDPQTGQRVDQYTPIGPFYTYGRSDYLQSGYRQTRSSVVVGGSADHMHIVEEWGRPVRPYEEWQFPFRPYSVPYALWGPPYAGMYSPVPYPYGPRGDGRGEVGPGWDGDVDPYGRQQPPPYRDDRHAPYRARPRGEQQPNPRAPYGN
jgi:hypothetical protein